jgi:pyruvate-formate lyase
MKHNDLEFWRALQALPAGHEDLPSPRVCRLLFDAMDGWKVKPRWLREQDAGHLSDHSPSGINWSELAGKPAAVRKAMAVCRMLEIVSDPVTGMKTGACRVSPDELIVGTMPPFSVGQGKEVIRYLTDEESLRGAIDMVNEWSPMGHVVPNHGVVILQGLEALVTECETGADSTRKSNTAAFYESVKICLEGVIHYANRYADAVESLGKTLKDGDENRDSLRSIAARLRHAPAKPARTFHEALQAVYIVHCALHWTAEIVPLGRLDQLLCPFYDRDIRESTLTREEAQEILDCFWIKLDERVILNRRHAEDRFTWADGTLTGSRFGPFFDQGGLLNQWMQQVTIGGVLANESPQQQDASNDLTYLFLECARRLPLNSPTLDLRVHRGTPKSLFQAAARTLLSGGAHPVILNDDRIVPALKNRTGGKVSLRSARNYACDGCYETMFAGETEFSFGFVPALDCLEKALNRGAALLAAGPVHLRGEKTSWRSKPAGEIASFEELRSIMRKHMLLGCHKYLADLLRLYGNKAELAPSPLLSALIGGCLETGRDITAGGARYHLFSPLMTGVSSAADSLMVIKRLVFEQKRFSLDELVSCLRSDWGDQPESPGLYLTKDRCHNIRVECMAQPKFGQGQREVDEIAWQLLEDFYACVQEARSHPTHQQDLAALKAKYDLPSRPFELLLAPGVGTFEQYVFGGSMAGASADGRRAGKPIASDLSPAPVPSDLPAKVDSNVRTRHVREVSLEQGLRSYAHDCMELLPDGAPADFNIPEDYPSEKLAQAIERFAGPTGGSVCTFTVANPETFAAAIADPERHNLLRVRMGGWTEFFITLFPDHQSQHMRRPLFVPEF